VGLGRVVHRQFVERRASRLQGLGQDRRIVIRLVPLEESEPRFSSSGHDGPIRRCGKL